MLGAILAVVVSLAVAGAGVQIGFALFVTGFGFLWWSMGYDVATSALKIIPYTSVANEALTVLPLFILSGTLCFASGVASDAFNAANKWLGRLPGGLGLTTIAGCAAFAATTGSSIATAATLGKIGVPEMRKHGYSGWLATGIAASGGVLGIMIPPSVPLVIYGIITETSIGRLLIAGVIPGLVTAFVYALGLFVLAVLRPNLAPRGDRFSWKERFRSVPKVWGVLVIFLVVVGGIFTGIFTPSEAAAAGATIALILLVSRLRSKSWGSIVGAFQEAASTACMIFFIIIGALVFSAYIALTGAANELTAAILGLGWPRYGILGMLIFVYIPLGMFLDSMAMCLITVPLFFPIVIGLGFDPVWFGVMIVSVWELAQITPPVGINVYVLGGLFPDVPLENIFLGCSLFIFMHLFVLALLLKYPVLALWLPNLMF